MSLAVIYHGTVYACEQKNLKLGLKCKFYRLKCEK
jgi:hypothetical protein